MIAPQDLIIHQVLNLLAGKPGLSEKKLRLTSDEVQRLMLEQGQAISTEEAKKMAQVINAHLAKLVAEHKKNSSNGNPPFPLTRGVDVDLL